MSKPDEHVGSRIERKEVGLLSRDRRSGHATFILAKDELSHYLGVAYSGSERRRHTAVMELSIAIVRRRLNLFQSLARWWFAELRLANEDRHTSHYRYQHKKNNDHTFAFARVLRVAVLRFVVPFERPFVESFACPFV